MLKWAKTDISNVAGGLSLLAGLFIWATTYPRIRRKKFEVFFYTHHLYILFLILFVLHVGSTYICIMLPGFYLFLVDRFLRFLQSRSRVRLISARVLPCKTLELNFSKSPDLRYTPTSIMFVNVPSISKLQWHPFTVTSSCNLEPEKLSIMIKGEGSWSKRLYQILSSPSAVDHLGVSVEGPYGPPSIDFLRHDIVVMVSGGSGITPFISIIRELIFMDQTPNCKTPEILLISCFKNTSDLTMLDLLLPISGSSPSEFSSLRLQIEAYITREKHQPLIQNQKSNIRNLWFKTSPANAPIAAVLGKNGWLWLGAVITSSSMINLLLLGILTRYYIDPVDHNSNEFYPFSSRAALNMVSVLVAIALATAAAFLCNKKKNATESKQIQNLETPPSVSPDSTLFCNTSTELESFPQQSLVQSTNVHLGTRPDLKRILFERKEPNVGVLVCGPKEMRREVGKICSSGLADNLHFESISFSW